MVSHAREFFCGRTVWNNIGLNVTDYSAILAGDTFPGPLIVGQIVRSLRNFPSSGLDIILLEFRVLY